MTAMGEAVEGAIKGEAEKQAIGISQELDQFIKANDFQDPDVVDNLVRTLSSVVGFMGLGVAAGVFTGPGGAAAISSVAESSVEHGLVIKELIDLGMPPQEAYDKSAWVFMANLPMNFVIDRGLFRFLPEGSLGKAIKKFKGDPKRIALEIAKGSLKQARAEAIQ